MIENLLIHFTYFALVLILFAAGMGLPIPEDIPLILSGYLCTTFSPIDDNGGHLPHLWLMMIAGMIGVLGGDSIIYFIGRRGVHGRHFIARHLRKILNSRRRQRVESHFIKHGNLTVFCGRFLPGARPIVFVMAGISKMGYIRFLLIDGLAAAISVPLFIFLGYHFANEFDSLKNAIIRVKHIVGPIAAAFLAIVVIIYLLRRRKRLADPLGAAPPPEALPSGKVAERV